MKAILTREPSTDQGTFGKFVIGNLSFNSIELPWKDNEHGKSCIPTGIYPCIWHNSPHHGWVYQVTNVPDRDNILIHVGNWAGDTDLGYKSDFLGCIGLGTNRAVLDNQNSITGSSKAIQQFEDFMKQQPFELEII